MKFVIVALLSCQTITPSDGPLKDLPTTSCAEAYPGVSIRADLIATLVPEFHSYQTTKGWVLNAPYCRIQLSGLGNPVFDVSASCDALKGRL